MKHKFDIGIKFEPRDIWIGLYWNTTNARTDKGQEKIAITFYICIIPLFPIRITVWNPISIPFSGGA